MTVRGRSVMFVINGLGTGGSERSVAELIPHLRDAGIEPSFACLHRRSEGVQAAVEASGVRVHYLDRARSPLARARRLRRMISLGGGADLVHTVHFESDLAGRLAARGLRPRVVCSLVGMPYARARRTDPNLRCSRLEAVRWVDGWTGRRLVDRFHAVSDSVKQAAIVALGIPAERVTVIRRGRDPSRLGEPGLERRRRVRAALGLAPDAEVIITVGRQEHPKGLRHLLAAAARLLPTRPRAVLLLAGREGNTSAELRQLTVRLGLGAERVRFLGHRDDVPDLLAAADVFALPSLYEGLPGALIEAMALGLPAVASDIPAVHEVVEPGRSALLVPAAEPEPLAAALNSLVADPARARALGARGREIFFQKFTLERYAREMIDLYLGLLET